MAINNTHPAYGKMESRWVLCCDSYEGEFAIKLKGATYLPATSGQIADGAGMVPESIGERAYNSYKLRAVYPDIYQEAVGALIGIMHREPPKIDLPRVLDGMRGNSTLLGESLEILLRKINARQLITGRLGLLGDIDTQNGVARPVIVVYNELAILNWNDTNRCGVNSNAGLVILDESQLEMNENFSWANVEKYRVIGFVDGGSLSTTSGIYGSAVLTKSDDLQTVTLKPPNVSGATLDELPFVFVNTKDLSPNPDIPPLESLGRLSLAIYRGEADYRQNLFMQGQDTLVRIGAYGDEDDIVRTGAGSRIDVAIGGDAKYIGVNSSGLAEQRQALENDYGRALQKSGQLLDATSRAKESGDALRIRVAAQTATLPQIAKTGAAALERVLKILARWYGADPEEVVVTPNLNFTNSDLNGQTLVQMMQAKGLGAPISEQSIHEWLQRKGATKFTYLEEQNIINQEEAFPGGSLISLVDSQQGS